MNIQEKALEAISIIDKQLVELNKIFVNARNSNELKIAWNKLERWKDRSVKLLTDNIHPNEGKKLKEERLTSFSMYDAFANFTDEVKMYEAFLLSLRDELENYPEDIFSYQVKEGSVPCLEIKSEGVFFAGQCYDAFQLVKEILSQATQSIILIDGYINDNVLNLFTLKKTDVEVSILTKAVSPIIRTAANAFNRQFGNLSIRTSQAFHDRFLIIDDKDFYHFGASIKDLGSRGFMFSRIEEPRVMDSLRAEWAQEWATANVEI